MFCTPASSRAWFTFVGNGDFAPDAAFQKTFVVLVEAFRDGDALGIEVFHARPVPSLLFLITDMDLVDEPVLALGGHPGLGRIGFVRADIIVLQSRQDRLEPGLDFLLLVTGAVAGQKKFQHKSRYVGAFFDVVQKILAHHLSGKDVVEFLVERVHGFPRLPQYFPAGTCRGNGRKGIFPFRHAFSQAPRKGFGVAGRNIVDIHQFH